jgi:hypothetical protein
VKLFEDFVLRNLDLHGVPERIRDKQWGVYPILARSVGWHRDGHQHGSSPNPIPILLPTEELATKCEHTHGKELFEPELKPIMCCPPLGIQLANCPSHSNVSLPLHV